MGAPGASMYAQQTWQAPRLDARCAGTGRWTVGLLLATFAVGLLQLVDTARTAAALGALPDDTSAKEPGSPLQLVFRLGGGAISITLIVVFLVWFDRAYSDARQRDPRLLPGSRWGVWLVPIIGPLLALSRLRMMWMSATGRSEAPVGAWIGAYVGSMAISLAATGIGVIGGIQRGIEAAQNGTTVITTAGFLHTLSVVGLVTAPLSLVAALYAAWAVRLLTAALDRDRAPRPQGWDLPDARVLAGVAAAVLLLVGVAGAVGTVAARPAADVIKDAFSN